MKKSIEDYQNLIELLKQALLFYGDKKNYDVNVVSGEQLVSMTELDEGAQAKFALDKIKEFQNTHELLEKEFIKNMTDAIESNENQDTLINLIETYKEKTE